MSEPTQSEIPIPAGAKRAAVYALRDARQEGADTEGQVEAAIRSFLSEMQFEVEREELTQEQDGYRLVSAWQPVGQTHPSERVS